MEILCPVSEWKDHVAKRGRGVGETSTNRFVIGIDKYNWIIGVQTKNKEGIFPISYFGNFKTLLPNLNKISHNKKEQIQIINKIVSSLSTLSGIAIDFKMEEQHIGDIGKYIDDIFNTSFLRTWPPTVFENLYLRDLKNTNKKLDFDKD